MFSDPSMCTVTCVAPTDFTGILLVLIALQGVTNIGMGVKEVGNKGTDDVEITVGNHISRFVVNMEDKMYIYLFPHSCYFPDIFYSIIYGMIKRIFGLTSFSANVDEDVKKFYNFILCQGHDPDTT